MTLGSVLAAVIARAQDRVAEGAVAGAEGVVGRVTGWLRATFKGDERADSALQLVERAPDSDSAVQGLAAVLDARARDDAEFAQRLASFVEEAQRDLIAGGFVTQVTGNAQVGKIINIGRARDVSL